MHTEGERPAPRPLLPRQLPAMAWLGLSVCAMLALAWLLFATNPPEVSLYYFFGEHKLVPIGKFGRVGLALLLATPVLFARRAPVTTLVVVLAVTVAESFVMLRSWPLMMVAMALVCWIAAVRSRRLSVACALLAMAIWVGLWMATTPWLRLDSGKVPILLLPVVIAWVVGNSVQQRRDYTEAVRVQAMAGAVMAERLRIARELHDIVAHSIGIIAIQAGVGNRVIETQPAEARNALAAIETTSRDTLAGLRRMLGALRRADTDPADTEPAPGLADLARLASATTDAGVRVDVHWQGRPTPLPADLDLSAFRIIQEAVTNVVRHSGARQCQVSVDYRDEDVAIEVIDNGHGGGAGQHGAGYGIAGMRERVGLLRGQFSAGPRPEGGFRVAAVLPR